MEKEQILKEEIIIAETRLLSAQLKSDLEVLNELLNDNLIAITPNGQKVTKEMDLSSHRNKTMIIEDAKTNIEKIEIYNDTAYAVIYMKTKGLMLGNPVEGEFRYLRTWKKLNGKLQIICASITTIK